MQIPHYKEFGYWRKGQEGILHVPRIDWGETETKRLRCYNKRCDNNQRYFHAQMIGTAGWFWCFDNGCSLTAEQVSQAQTGFCDWKCELIYKLESRLV